MSLTDLHAARLDGASAGAVQQWVTDSESALYVAVWAHVCGDPGTASEAARRAAEADPSSEFARLLARHLGDAERADGVYDSPAAFRAFIRGGGNVPLYAATSAALREVHARRPGALLDIGVGDGLALLPSLAGHVDSLDVVEPSRTLLDETVDALTRRGVVHRAYHGTVEEFARDHSGHGWDLTQATFALQSLPPQQRRETLRWLHSHTRALVIVEFDVPEAPSPFEPAWFRDCVRRTEHGLREYHEDRELVGRGFVLPVVLGFFDTSARRTNWEQPVEAWVDDLRVAGFTEVSSRFLHDYWWRPAHVVEAHR